MCPSQAIDYAGVLQAVFEGEGAAQVREVVSGVPTPGDESSAVACIDWMQALVISRRDDLRPDTALEMLYLATARPSTIARACFAD